MFTYRHIQILLILFIGLMPYLVQAQYATGLSDDDAAYDTTSLIVLPNISKAVLPRSMDLKPYCPMPGNQGSISSCVGWSVGYGLMTIEKAIQNRETDTKTLTASAFSAMFVYNQIRGSHCQSLSSLNDAMTFLMTRGNCSAREFDVGTDDCYVRPDEALKERAKANVIADFNRLFDAHTEGVVKRDMIRQVLSQKKPVAIGLKINDQFKTLLGKGFWYPNLGKQPTEGHAMVVVGYDDDAECFTLLNSWGKVWGQDGFIKIKYADMEDYCRYAYVIYLSKNGRATEQLAVTASGIEKPAARQSLVKTIVNPTQVVEKQQNTPAPDEDKIGNQTPRDLIEMGGNVEINYYTRRAVRETGEPIFETIGVEQVGNHYALLKKDWRVGDQFQLALTSNISGAYIYIISINPQNEAKIMFPRHEEFGKKYKGFHESPLLMLDGARVILPNRKQAITVDVAGTDRICILFSTRQIKKSGLPAFCKTMQNWTGDFDAYLHKFLGSSMIPSTETNFSTDKVSFSVATRSDASIVPIIIEFQSQ